MHILPKLQFITMDTPQRTHLEQVWDACSNGILWVQLRLKNKTTLEMSSIATEARKITQSFGAKLIINDSINLAINIQADGVHLGKEDMSLEQSIKVLPKGMILGRTAYSFNDIETISKYPVTYIGLGPFRYTTTKKTLHAPLGLNYYQKVVVLMKQKNIAIPLVAVGGIRAEDIQSLFSVGIKGVAVASAIASHKDIKKSIFEFKYAFNQIT